MAGGDGTKATITALCANFGIAIAKFVAFVFTGSASMLAEGIHSVADASNQALLLLGMRRARRAPTALHPFGFGRERYFWSFVVAIVLFTLGSGFSLMEGIEKLRHPHEIDSLSWAIGVLTVAIVFEAYSMWVAVGEANAVRTGSWWSFIRNAKSPELPVVVLEDLGALLGLVLALVGVSLGFTTGDPRWDAAGSLAIGVLLGVIAIVLAIEMRSLLLGEAATPQMRETIRATMAEDDRVLELIHLRTQHIGPQEVLVAAKVNLLPTLSFDEVVRAIDEIEARVRAAVPEATAMYIEPDTSE